MIVGIDVDLHDSERDRVRKLTFAGSAAAMEHILEAGVGIRSCERLLARVQDLGPQDHVSGGIGSVHVAERCRDQVAAALADPQRVGDAEEVGRRGVQLVAPAHGAHDPVLLTADNTGLDLEDDVEVAASASRSDAIRRFSSSGSVEPSNMCE